MKRAFYSILVIGILLATGFLNFGSSNNLDDKSNDTRISPGTRSGRSPYDYDNIYISGDDDLIEYVEDNDCEGNGTEEDPFVIRDLVIDIDRSGPSSAIYIVSTTYHLVFQNISIENSRYGIHIDASDNILMINLNIDSCEKGIYIHTSGQNVAVECSKIQNCDHGIELYGSPDVIISHSTLHDCEVGISINRDSSRTLVKGCYMSCNNIGMYLDDVDDVHLDNCTIRKCTSNGIYLSRCLNFRVEWSEISECGIYGIFSSNSHNVTIIHSSILNNVDTGIYSRDTDRFLVFDSTFLRTGITLGNYYDIRTKDIRIRNNTINGKDLIFKLNEDLSAWSMPENTGQLFLYYCSNIKMIGGTFTDVKIPIYLNNCINVMVKGAVISKNQVYGINVLTSSNVSLANCIIDQNNGYGANFESTEDISIQNCIFSNNNGGLILRNTRLSCAVNHSTFIGANDLFESTHSGDLFLTNCTFESDGMDGAYISRPYTLTVENNTFIHSGMEFTYPPSGNSTFSNNTVNGKPLVYIRDKDLFNSTLEVDPGQVILHNVKNLDLTSLDIQKANYGIQIYSSEHINVSDTLITGCLKGIYISSSKEIIIQGSEMSDCCQGLIFEYSQDAIISNCVFKRNIGLTKTTSYGGFVKYIGSGISCSSLTDSTIVDCYLKNNQNGISQIYSNVCDIINCTIMNGSTGIELMDMNKGGYIIENKLFNLINVGVMVCGPGYDIWRNELVNCSFKVLSGEEAYDPGLSENNTVNGLPIYYRYKEDISVNGMVGRGQYIAMDCNSVKIENISMEGGTNSISILFSDVVNITGSYFTEDGESIYLKYIRMVNISKCTFKESRIGINLSSEQISDTIWSITENLFLQCDDGLSTGIFNIYHTGSMNIFKNIFYQCTRVANLVRFWSGYFFLNDVIGTTGPIFNSDHGPSYIYSNNFFYNNGTRMRWDEGRFQGLETKGDYYHPNFFDPTKNNNMRGNFWSDSCFIDVDRDGILEDPVVVDLHDDGTEIMDSYPLAEPAPSSHIVLHANITHSMIYLSWDLPKYDFLGDIVSVSILRMEEGKEPIPVDTFVPGVTNLSFQNTGDGSIWVFIAVPNFQKGPGFWSNPVTIVNDNRTPDIRITYPIEFSLFNRVYPEIEFRWELFGLNPSLVNFMVRPDDAGWENVGNMTIWGEGDWPWYGFYRWDYGWHRFEVRGTDYLGRTFNDSVEFLVDYRGPKITITSPRIHEVILTRKMTVSWTVEDDLLDVKNVSLRLDERPWLNVTGSNSIILEDLDEGSHQIYLRSFDTAGNIGENHIDFTVEYYITPISIISPREGDFFNSREIEILWETGNADWVQESYMSLDGGPFFVITKDGQRFQVFDSEGNHTITIKAANTAGDEFVDTVNFTIDTIVPSVTNHYPIGDNVPIDTPIYVEFSEKMNRSSVEIFVNLWSGPPIWDGNRAYFNRPKEFQYGQEVWVEVLGKDHAGNYLEPFSYVFTITDKGEVRGRVVDESFNPVKGALVVFENGQEIETASDGTFSIMVSDGGYRIIVEKEGFALTKGYAESRAGKTTNIGDLILRPEETPEEGSKDEGTMLISIVISILLVLIMIILVFVLVRKYRSMQYFEE